MERSDEMKAQYKKMKKAWSDAIRSDAKHNMLFAHHLVYKQLCGRSWKECLAPTTKKETLKYLYFGDAKRFFKDHASVNVLDDIIDAIKTERGEMI